MRDAINWPEIGRNYAIFAAIGSFLAFVGPFGTTDGLPFWRGWLFWVGVILVGCVIAEAVSYLTFRYLGGLPLWVRLAVMALVMGIVMTPVVAAFAVLIDAVIPIRYWPGLFVGVFIISAFMTGVGYLMDRAFNPSALEALDTSSDAVEKFLDRLGPKYRGAQLHAISSEDHYLRIHTDKGSELILMRLADAVRELEGAGGVQSHRSWWVSVDAVRDVTRTNGRMILRLPNGLDVPVSRTCAKDVRQAGL